MKQCITDKQFIEFVKPNGIYDNNRITALRKLLKLKDNEVLSSLLFNIGKMIEMLGHKLFFIGHNPEFTFNNVNKPHFGVLLKRDNDENGDKKFEFKSKELCDALWEAIEEISDCI